MITLNICWVDNSRTNNAEANKNPLDVHHMPTRNFCKSPETVGVTFWEQSTRRKKWHLFHQFFEWTHFWNPRHEGLSQQILVLAELQDVSNLPSRKRERNTKKCFSPRFLAPSHLLTGFVNHWTPVRSAHRFGFTIDHPINESPKWIHHHFPHHPWTKFKDMDRLEVSLQGTVGCQAWKLETWDLKKSCDLKPLKCRCVRLYETSWDFPHLLHVTLLDVIFFWFLDVWIYVASGIQVVNCDQQSCFTGKRSHKSCWFKQQNTGHGDFTTSDQ